MEGKQRQTLSIWAVIAQAVGFLGVQEQRLIYTLQGSV